MTTLYTMRETSRMNTLRSTIFNIVGLLIGLAGLPTAQADSVTMTVQGSVIPPTCSATQPGTLTLGTLTTSDISATGKISSSTKPFTVSVSCTGTTGVTMSPSGNQPTTAGVYKSTGSASNVDILMECKDNSGSYNAMSNGTAYSMGSFGSGTTNVTCQASYYSYSGATGGSVSSIMTLNFSYN